MAVPLRFSAVPAPNCSLWLEALIAFRERSPTSQCCPECRDAGLLCPIYFHSPTCKSKAINVALPSSAVVENELFHPSANVMRTTPSRLNTTHDLALLSQFHGHSKVAQLVLEVELPFSSDLTDIERALSKRALMTYKKPAESEAHCTQRNLDDILDTIRTGWVSSVATGLTLARGRQITQDASLFLTKDSAELDGAIMYVSGHVRVGVIGGVAKGLFAGPAEAYSQIAVVPFVLHVGDCVQFGAVYIIEPNFPCAVLLSAPLSLVELDGRDRICRWIRALRLFALRQRELFVSLNLAHRPAATVPKCALRPAGVFLKPVQATTELVARYEWCHLMTIFQLLHQHETCRIHTMFPLGSMGVLARPPLGGGHCDEVIGQLWTADPEFYQSRPGWPIVIYPRLSAPQWRTAAGCPELYHFKDEFLALLETVVQAVEEAGVIHLDLRLANIMVRLPTSEMHEETAGLERTIDRTMAEVETLQHTAQLIATEVDAARAMKEAAEQACGQPRPEGQTLSAEDRVVLAQRKLSVSEDRLRALKIKIQLAEEAAAAAMAALKRAQEGLHTGGTEKLALRLIDWDYSARLGHPVDPSILDAYRDDSRYPSNLPLATQEYHQFFLERIRAQLETDVAQASERAAKRRRLTC